MTNKQEISISDERLSQIHQGIQNKRGSGLRLISDSLWLAMPTNLLADRILTRYDHEVGEWGREIGGAGLLGRFENWLFSIHFARRIDINIAAQNSETASRAVYNIGIKRNTPGFFAYLTQAYNEIHDGEEHQAGVRASNLWGVDRIKYYEWTHAIRKSALKLGTEFYLPQEFEAQSLRKAVLVSTKEIASQRPAKEDIEAVESGLLL